MKIQIGENKKIYIYAFIIFIIDQISKLLIINNINYLEEIEIINNFFAITYVKNTGGAFSIFNNNMYLLVVISILFLIGVIYFINKNKFTNKIDYISISFILGGLLGNLFDRIFRNGVVDFLSFDIFKYRFPIFNIADIFIVIGITLMIITEIWGEINENRRRKYKN